MKTNIQFFTIILSLLVFQTTFSGCKKQPIQASLQSRLDKAAEKHFDGVILFVRQNGESVQY